MKSIKYAAGGGGVAGIIHVGALQALNDKGFELKSITGVSAGAGFGALYFCCLKLNDGDVKNTVKTVYDLMWDMDFNKFKDDNWFFRLFYMAKSNPKKFGMYKGNNLFKFFNEATAFMKFEDLEDESLVITATEMYSGSLCVFSKETTPKLKIAEAIRASSSIQGYFLPAKIKRDFIEGALFKKNCYKPENMFDSYEIGRVTDNDGYLYFWDGGNLGNCRNDIAVQVHDRRLPTLGVSLTYSSVLEQTNFSSVDVLTKTIDTMMNSAENMAVALSRMHTERPDLVIRPDRHGISATDFNLSNDSKLKLINSGYTETIKYCDNLWNQ